MTWQLHRFTNKELPALLTGGELYEAEHVKEAREIARQGGFAEALKKLKEKGLLDREVMRVKALYSEKLSGGEETFMNKATWEAFTIMELFHPETADHCVETYRIVRDRVERPLLGSGIVLADIIDQDEVPLPVLYRACLLHDIGKVDVPHEIISNTKTDKECADLLYQHHDDAPVRAALKRNGIGALPSDPSMLIHMLAVTGKRPMGIAPAELLLEPETVEDLAKRGFDVNNKTLAELILPHEEYSGSDLVKLGFVEESKIAARHHNYKDSPSGVPVAAKDQNLYTMFDIAEILHLADVEQAMKAHRGYKPSASNVAAMAMLVHEAELGHIKNTDLVVAWVRDEMERLEKNHDELKEALDNPTDHAHLEAVVDFLHKHTLERINIHMEPILPVSSSLGVFH